MLHVVGSHAVSSGKTQIPTHQGEASAAMFSFKIFQNLQIVEAIDVLGKVGRTSLVNLESFEAGDC